MSKATWTRKEGKNPSGGLNQKGRDSYNKDENRKEALLYNGKEYTQWII